MGTMSHSEPQLIIPFAKPSGMTSFTSLWQVKRTLGTKKVGHTGTLDSFADGLLVLLSGKLTKLVPYITDFDKTYLVRFYFGKETDTLDPEGTVINEKPLPTYSRFIAAVERFTGTIEQVPPVYSAVKQGGERLSDKIRRGETVTVQPRTVTIHEIKIEEIFYEEDRAAGFAGADIGKAAFGTGRVVADSDKLVAGAILQIRCSKGTYIRSLVRDVAAACGSAAYVYALRRTAVGPFTLEQAAGAYALPPFTGCAIHEYEAADKITHGTIPEISYQMLDQTAVPLDKGIAHAMHFQTAEIKAEFYSAFVTGKPIRTQWFSMSVPFLDDVIIAVFYQSHCVGLITKKQGHFSYQTVFGLPDRIREIPNVSHPAK